MFIGSFLLPALARLDDSVFLKYPTCVLKGVYTYFFSHSPIRHFPSFQAVFINHSCARPPDRVAPPPLLAQPLPPSSAQLMPRTHFPAIYIIYDIPFGAALVPRKSPNLPTDKQQMKRGQNRHVTHTKTPPKTENGSATSNALKRLQREASRVTGSMFSTLSGPRTTKTRLASLTKTHRTIDLAISPQW